MAFGPGSVIAGRYHADRLVGTGGMGEVWAGEHVGAGNKVALKRLLPAASKHPEVVTRFRREAILLGRIQSEHVARVFDFIDDQAFGPVLVMEFIEGPSLAQILEDRSLSVEEAIDLAADLAIALNDLHEAKVVHRDLKPGNIIMQPRNDDRPRAVIVDFGIGRQLSAKGSADEITGITRANIALGTVEYMAPEQILNSRDVTPLSDIYAVGAILYRSVAGVHAFGNRRGEELARAKLIEDAPALDTGRDDAAARGFADVVARCLKKRPAQRFGSATELIAAVRAIEDKMKEELEESTTAETRVMPIQPESSPGLAMPPPPPRSGPSVVIAQRAQSRLPDVPDSRPSRGPMSPAHRLANSASSPTPAMAEALPSRPSGVGFGERRGSMPSISDARGSVPSIADGRASMPSMSDARGSVPSMPEGRASMHSISDGGFMPRPSDPRASMGSIPEIYPGVPQAPGSRSGRDGGFGRETTRIGLGGKTVALAVCTAFAVGVAVGVVVAPVASAPSASASAPSIPKAEASTSPEPRLSAAPCPAPSAYAAAAPSASVSAAPSVSAPAPKPALTGHMPEGSWTPPSGTSSPRPPSTNDPSKTPAPIDSTPL